MLDSIDLSEISRANLNIVWEKPSQSGYTFELRLDAADGKVLGSFTLPGGGLSGNEKTPFISKQLSSAFAAVTDGKKHNLYVVSKPVDEKEPNQVAVQWIQFR
jgi:cytochrome c